jgi:hypothetical protein
LVAFEIGRALEAIRSTYTDDKGFFAEIEARFGWEKSSTYNYLSVGARFANRPEALQAIGPRLPATALFKLCAPSVDAEVFDTVLEAAQTRKVTLRQVEQLIGYGKLRSQLAENPVDSKILESTREALPVAVRPMPTLAELLSLFHRKGDVRPFADGLQITDREGAVCQFADIAAATQAWDMEWSRKTDYVRFELRLGDRVRFAELDIPEVDGRPVFPSTEFVRVCGLKNWRIQIEYRDEQYWAYRAGIVEHIAAIVPAPSIPVPAAAPAPVATFFTRPAWLHINAVMWRQGADDRQLGTPAEIQDEIVVIDWPDGRVRYTWQEFTAAGITNCTEVYEAFGEAFSDLGRSLCFDMLNLVLAQEG